MTLKNKPLCLAAWSLAALWTGSGFLEAQNTNEDVLVLTDFEESDVAAGWKTVNDNVMGGRSKGGPTFADGLLIFSGSTNTDGGGFSSIRSVPGEFDLSGKDGLLMRVKGDGRTYQASLRTDVTMRSWAVPFRADFETVKGEWREVFPSSRSSLFGQNLPDPPALDSGKVKSFGFMIYDKKDGAFSLEVDWVKAVNRGQGEGRPGTIVDQALADGRFGTLAAALTEAKLVEVLSGEGPFTVFAPTDEAFAKLPKGTVEELLKPENLEKLQGILKYHVTSGAIPLAAALDAGAAETVQGQSISIGFADGRVRVNGASILNADIGCSNGVIHVIDSVLLPSEPANDILRVAEQAGTFTTLLAAVKAAGLGDVLSGEGPITILAPTDAAFAKLPKGTVEELLKPENRGKLAAILSYHAIGGKVSAGDALNTGRAKTLNGSSVEFGLEDGVLKVNGATIRKADLKCENGVIHVIDSVLLPPSKDSADEQEEASARSVVSPAKRIEAAIERGVPIFNSGDAGKCAAIYRDCLAELSEEESIDAKLRTAVKALLKHGVNAESDVDRAWLYRKGLDHLYTMISGS